jgi:serine/threonine protein kinase
LTENSLDTEVGLQLFEAINVIGCGTFGVVRLMKTPDHEDFAVKFFVQTRRLTKATAREAFCHEFEAFQRLHHPCIVPLYGFSPGTDKQEAA